MRPTIELTPNDREIGCGVMIVLQPEIPTPLVVRFPFPAWATRKSEVAEAAVVDPFAGFRER